MSVTSGAHATSIAIGRVPVAVGRAGPTAIEVHVSNAVVGLGAPSPAPWLLGGRGSSKNLSAQTGLISGPKLPSRPDRRAFNPSVGGAGHAQPAPTR
jgi:hypothetical protein